MADVFAELKQGRTASDPAETRALARAFAEILPPDRTVALRGDLGSGKTTWVRGMAEAWDIPGPVTSPTFNLFNLHRGRRLLLHVDAYRLEKPADAADLLIEDFLRSPWCLAVEWPERLPEAYLEQPIVIECRFLDQRRRHFRIT